MCSKPNENAADNVPEKDIAVKRTTVKKDMLPSSEAIDESAAQKAAAVVADVIIDGSSQRWMQLPAETKAEDAESVAKEWCAKMNGLVYGHYEFVEVSNAEEGLKVKVDFKVAKRQAAAASEHKKASEADPKQNWEAKVEEEALRQSQ